MIEFTARIRTLHDVSVSLNFLLIYVEYKYYLYHSVEFNLVNYLNIFQYCWESKFGEVRPGTCFKSFEG